MAALSAGLLGGCLSSGPEEKGASKPAWVLQPSGDTSSAEGEEVRFEVRVAGEAPFEYQWFRDGKPLKGKTGSVLRLEATSALDSALFHCVVTDARGDTLSSAPFRLRVDGLRFLQEPRDTAIVHGDSLRFSVVVAGGTPPYTYVWWRGRNGVGNEIGGEGLPVFTGFASQVVQDGWEIWVVATDARGARATSRKALVRVGFKASDTLTLGAQAHPTQGAFLELDSGKVWTAAAANGRVGRIDFVHLFYNGKPMLNGAKAARDSGARYAINLTSGWGNEARNLLLVRLSARPEGLSLGTAAFHEGTKLKAVEVAAGDKFMAISAEQRFYYLEVRSVTGGASGSMEIVVHPGETGYFPYDMY